MTEKIKERRIKHVDIDRSPSLRHWERPSEQCKVQQSDAMLDCGWGRLIFAQTYSDPNRLVSLLRRERKQTRDIAIYVRDPHVLMAYAPQEVFIDPSYTYRLELTGFSCDEVLPQGVSIRRLRDMADARVVRNIYKQHHMVPPSASFMVKHADSNQLVYLLAENSTSGEVLGVVTGADHTKVFNDRENGSSLWALAVDARCPFPGVGKTLVCQLANYFKLAGRNFMDLSVMHDNNQAIALYEKLGFQRVPVFALKRKNQYNEPLYVGESPEAELNPYATIIVKEARRRGIGVTVLDAEHGYFELSLGGRSIVCRESLCELTSAIAMSRCDDKAVTRKVLVQAGLKVPAQMVAGDDKEQEAFLQQYGSVVVKPARGEQGMGISIDVRDRESLKRAIANARKICDCVIIENMVQGHDLRIIVIDYKVVAAAIRRPAEVRGTGRHTIFELIKKQSRKRRAATGGESCIPLGDETERCLAAAGYSLQDVLPAGTKLQVRKTANLHTGGTIHDVTGQLHPVLKEAAERAALALNIPVTGLDLLVPRVDGPEYVMIEANERPGLANHDPQPTAERFVDLLFPQTAAMGER